MRLDRRTFVKMAAAGAIAPAIPRAALGQDAVSFAGQTVEWIIPFGEGGGNDAWARFFAPYLAKYLPGSPNVLVRNEPGGGGLSGFNNYAQRPGNDGLSLIGTSASNHFPFLLGDPRVRYDYADFVPVLGSPIGAVFFALPGLGITEASQMGDLRGKDLVFANTGATSLDLALMLGLDMLGLTVKHVFGMNSRGETRMAFERGEANIDYQTTASYLANVVPLVEAGKAVPLFTMGALDTSGAVVRDPTFPDLPHYLEVYEMVNGKPPEAGDQLSAYLAFFNAGFPAQKLALLHNTTPQPIIAAYTKAFADAVADPELQSRKAQVLGDYVQATGDAAHVMYKTATTISPEARSYMQNYLRTKYNVDI